MPWPYDSPSRPSWPYGSPYLRDVDRHVFIMELRQAVAAAALSEGADLTHQGNRASLVAIKHLDQIVREAPNLFGRISRLAWNAGASWEEIASQLGITKQAAWKRFSRRGRRVPTPPMLALQQCLERLMEGDDYHPLYPVSWETPLPALDSRSGALQGLRLLDRMHQQADGELILLAAEARFIGATWQVIASTLGVGPQAAHKRLSKQVGAVIEAAQGQPKW